VFTSHLTGLDQVSDSCTVLCKVQLPNQTLPPAQTCDSERNAVGPESITQADVPAFASDVNRDLTANC
jgi:hypothetical protein